MVELQLRPPALYIHPVYTLLRPGRMGLGSTLDIKILKRGGTLKPALLANQLSWQILVGLSSRITSLGYSLFALLLAL